MHDTSLVLCGRLLAVSWTTVSMAHNTLLLYK